MQVSDQYSVEACDQLRCSPRIKQGIYASEKCSMINRATGLLEEVYSLWHFHVLATTMQANPRCLCITAPSATCHPLFKTSSLLPQSHASRLLTVEKNHYNLRCDRTTTSQYRTLLTG